jgi:hypothetical protein
MDWLGGEESDGAFGEEHLRWVGDVIGHIEKEFGCWLGTVTRLRDRESV